MRLAPWILLAIAPTVAAIDRAAAQSCVVGTAADEFAADAAGLTREWILQLPFVALGARLEQVVPGDGLVVAQTSDGTVHAIAGASLSGKPTAVGEPLPGSLLWSRRVDSVGGAVMRAGIGIDTVAVAHDRDITALERGSGSFRWQQAFDQSASGGTAVIGNWIYSPTAGHSMSRFPTHPLRQPDAFKAAEPPTATAKGKATKKGGKERKARKESLEPLAIDAVGDVRLTPQPFVNGVLWCTAAGDLVTLQETQLDWQRFEFELVNPPAGQPALVDRSIYAATTAGDLARIDLPKSLRQLQLVWHAVLPGPASSGPFVAGETLVVSLGDLGLAAYSTVTGDQVWHCPLTGRILAVAGGRVWFVDELGKLAALDLADGAPRTRLCLGPFTLPVVNTLTGRLLLASPSGMIASLLPRGPVGTPTPAAARRPTDPAAAAPAKADPAATPRP